MSMRVGSLLYFAGAWRLGYVTEQNYRVMFADAVDNILAWSTGAPLRVLTQD